MCGNGGMCCGVAGGSGVDGCSDGGSGGGGGDIAARGPQGVWMQYFPLERLNSPCGGGGGGVGCGDGGGGGGV